MQSRRSFLWWSALGVAGGCAAPRRDVPRFTPLHEREPPVEQSGLVVCGRRFPIDVPLVLWSDPGGYDASSTRLRFPEDPPPEPIEGLRYAPGRKGPDGRTVLPAEGLDALRAVVDQFVLHFDVCGLSRTCFKVLHDRRKLSVHFLLDVDGTLYQTLDLAHTAWHARQANARSVGVEIANIGAYEPGAKSPLDEWYARDAAGLALSIPARFGDGGVRTAGFRGRPARSERVRGTVQGQALEMVDFTPQQYLTLVRLAATLTRVFPRIAPDAPRGRDGRVRSDALADAEFTAFRGILGHHHVSKDKVDPGPAFDWEPFLRRVRQEIARAAPSA